MLLLLLSFFGANPAQAQLVQPTCTEEYVQEHGIGDNPGHYLNYQRRCEQQRAQQQLLQQQAAEMREQTELMKEQLEEQQRLTQELTDPEPDQDEE